MIATIDFEASGLNGYPIEVGVAIHTPGHDQISVWSSLIRPPAGWLQTMSWDPDAFDVHGIARADLKNAPSAWDVARSLNALLAPCEVAYCDGYAFDRLWLRLLVEECPDPCSFDLQGADRLARRLNIVAGALLPNDADDPVTHRAGPDAERLLRRALTAQHARVTELR